ANPVHGREVTCRIALVRVEYEFGFRSRAGREIEQEGIRRLRRNVSVASILLQSDLVRYPSGGLTANQDSLDLGVRGDAIHCAFIRHHNARAAAREPIADVAFQGQGGGRNYDRANLDGCQHELPNGSDVRKAQNHWIARLYPLALQKVRHAIRALSDFLVTELDLVLAFAPQPQGRLAIALRVDIKPVACPIEIREIGPTKFPVGPFIVSSVVEQKLASSNEFLCGRHMYSQWTKRSYSPGLRFQVCFVIPISEHC